MPMVEKEIFAVPGKSALSTEEEGEATLGVERLKTTSDGRPGGDKPRRSESA